MICPYHNQNTSLPVGFRIVAKTEYQTDKKDGKEKRRCPVPKNRYCSGLIKQSAADQIPFRYVLTDVWFASSENMVSVKHDSEKDFVMPSKTNRKVAPGYDDKRHGRYVRTDEVISGADTPTEIFIENTDFPMLMAKQAFANKDGSTGISYLVTGDTKLTYEQITAIRRKRWNVECHHKSLRQNASLEKSPTKTVTTRKNHFFASLCGYVRPGMPEVSYDPNHFAPKAKIYISALHSAYAELQKLQPLKLSA